MVKYLVLILGQKSKEEGLCKEATDALASIIRGDPCVEVRLAGIHQICDLVHNQKGSGLVETVKAPEAGNTAHNGHN